MKYVIRYLAAGVLPFIINIFIFLWHFDLNHFIEEDDIVAWTKDISKYEPPIDY